MTLTRKKKAAIAAVAHYLKMEAEAARFSNADMANAGDEPTTPLPADTSGPWAVSGRLHQMQLRSMMQLKAFHGCSRC